MAAAELLTRLRGLGVEASVEDGTLRLRGRRVVLEHDLRHELRSRREELIALLDGRPSPRRLLALLGESLGWPQVDLIRGIRLPAGHTCAVHHAASVRSGHSETGPE